MVALTNNHAKMQYLSLTTTYSEYVSQYSEYYRARQAVCDPEFVYGNPSNKVVKGPSSALRAQSTDQESSPVVSADKSIQYCAAYHL